MILLKEGVIPVNVWCYYQVDITQWEVGQLWIILHVLLFSLYSDTTLKLKVYYLWLLSLNNVGTDFQYDFVDICSAGVHEFHEKPEKLKKKKLWITTNKKVAKKVV